MEENLFKSLRMEQNEVVMCRFLADLLDPKGWHNSGTKYLKTFMEKVIKLENAEKTDLSRTCVMTEYLLDNGRKIDIMLQNPDFSLPIEAKINAADQQSQCYDYHHYARNAKLVYLTKEGRTPTGQSLRSQAGKAILPVEQITCISWKDICIWLESDPAPIPLIKQYTKAIHSFLPETKTPADPELIRAVLTAFEARTDNLISNYGLKKPFPASQYHYYKDWTNSKLTFCPGLNYCVQDITFPRSPGLQMWFRVEVSDDGYLTAGFCLTDTKSGVSGTKTDKVKVGTDEITDLRQYGQMQYIITRDDWWFVWRFSNGRQDVNRDDVPNFRTMNQCAANLLNEEKRKKFITETIRILEDHLLRYLKP